MDERSDPPPKVRRDHRRQQNRQDGGRHDAQEVRNIDVPEDVPKPDHDQSRIKERRDGAGDESGVQNSPAIKAAKAKVPLIDPMAH